METFSALLALCAGNSRVTSGFPSQRPVTRSLDVFFDMRLNKRLCKQSRRRWFETPWRSLWCHCYGWKHMNQILNNDSIQSLIPSEQDGSLADWRTWVQSINIPTPAYPLNGKITKRNFLWGKFSAKSKCFGMIYVSNLISIVRPFIPEGELNAFILDRNTAGEPGKKSLNGLTLWL